MANYAYDRFELVSADVGAAIVATEAKFFSTVPQIDAAALQALRHGHVDTAVEMLTAYSVAAGSELVAEWQKLFGTLFVKYRDGFISTPTSTPVCQHRRQFNCTFRPVPNSAETGYPTPWYSRIVAENGAHYAAPSSQVGSTRSTKKGL